MFLFPIYRLLSIVFFFSFYFLFGEKYFWLFYVYFNVSDESVFFFFFYLVICPHLVFKLEENNFAIGVVQHFPLMYYKDFKCFKPVD